jgi:hypothetical protein
MGPTVSRFSTARHPTNYAVPRICGYPSRLSAVHSSCGWPRAVPTLLTLYMACTPCSAWASHAARDFGRQTHASYGPFARSCT